MNIGNVPDNRKEILAKVFIQKQILKCSRRNIDGFQVHFKFKEKSNKGKSLENRVSTPYFGNKSAQSTTFSRFENIKRKDHHFNSNHKNDICFYYQKKKYRNSNCSNKNKSAVFIIAAITLKNEKILSRFLKRNKNNLDK